MLTFGNITRQLLPFLKKESYLDSLLIELNNYPHPDNNSQDVINEINKLIELTDSIANKEDIQKRYKLYDENFECYIMNVLSNTGIPKEEIEAVMKDIHADITPLLVKLKYGYQRVRPIQLSYMLQMMLVPYHSKSCDTPSYPSGHTLYANIYCKVLGNKYPKYYNPLMQLADDITDSRMSMGLSYYSDCTFADYISSCILSHPEFKTKYRL